MGLAHHHRKQAGTRARTTFGRRRDGEPGYVLVTFALLLVPLLLIVGLSVDVGSWYNRASDIQKAADAAALAGVVWLPDEVNAGIYAREAAARNGFTEGGNISIDVEKVGERQLRVTITDDEVGAFIGGGFGVDDIELARRGTAEYVLPVPLGSPRNFFGTGQLSTGFSENLWLSINPWCTDKVDGDRYQSPFVGNRPYGTTSSRCPTTHTGSYVNSEYRSTGYEFYIDVPTNRTGNIDVLLQDARFHTGSGLIDNSLYTGSQTYHYTLFAADDTPLTDADNVAVPGCSASYTATSAFTSGINFLGTTRWNRLCTISTAMRTGRYILRARNNVGQRYAAGANNFSIVAKYTSAAYTAAAALCDARTVTTCPRVYGKDAISVYASQSSSTADFFLAEIEPIHVGKTLQIELFDPGEGGSSIQLRRPTGANTWTDATFSWTSTSSSYPSGGPTTSLSVADSRYNGHRVRISIDLAGYSPPANNRWWQVRYNFGTGTVQDRTTWSARVIGDPVHLIEE